MADEPLLQAFWADVEVAGAADSPAAPVYPSISDIQQQYPNQVIQFLKQHGIKKLGETRLPAIDLPRLFAGDAFITRGSGSCLLNWEADWGVLPLSEEATSLASAADVQPGVSREASTTGRAGEGDWTCYWGRRNALARTTSDVYGWGSPTSRQGHSHSSGSTPWSAVASSALGDHVGRRGASTLRGPAPLPPRLLPPAAPLPPVPSVVLEAYVVAVRDAAAPGEGGLLRPLLRRWQLGSCSASAFGLPAVQAVVQYKWTRFARHLLLQQLCAYAVWLGSFTAFMMLFNSQDATIPDTELLSTWKGRLSVACEVLALLGMLPFAAAEVCVMHTYGLMGWLSAWNLLDCATYGLQLAITVLHLGVTASGPLWLTTAVAIQAILLIVRLTYFSRVFQATTFDFMGSLQTVINEVGWYMAVLLLLMWGFACAFFTLFREDKAADSFSSLPMSILTMLNYAVGGTSYYMKGLLASRQPAAAVVLCIVYQFLVSMLLMSLLTGVMTNALMKANQQEAVALVLNRAQVIDELETVLPQAVLRLLTPYGSTAKRSPAARTDGRGNGGSRDSDGGVVDGWERYVHVLRVNPRSLDSIDGEERLWPIAAGALGGGGGSDGATGGGRGGGNLVGGGGQGGSAGRLAAETPADKAGPSSGGDPDHRSAVGKLEARVRQMEGQLEGLKGAVQQLLELNTNVRLLLEQQRPRSQLPVVLNAADAEGQVAGLGMDGSSAGVRFGAL